MILVRRTRNRHLFGARDSSELAGLLAAHGPLAVEAGAHCRRLAHDQTKETRAPETLQFNRSVPSDKITFAKIIDIKTSKRIFHLMILF